MRPFTLLDFLNDITYNTAMKKNIEIMIISFTETGSRLNAVLKGKFCEEGIPCQSCCTERFADKFPGFLPLPKAGKEWIGAHWGKCGFIFIGAAGIAVRYIAPWVQDKFTDSPVVVMDERGHFVIPLLSGHIGGAVEIAGKVSKWTGAVPVNTTATDVRGKFAVDVFAAGNGMQITDRELAKEISAAVLAGKRIGFYSSLPVEGEIPRELKACASLKELEGYPYGIAVLGQEEHSEKSDGVTSKILRLNAVPGIIAGIGCRRGTKKDQLERGLRSVLDKNHIRAEQIECFVSIELKKDEEGLLKLAGEYRVPFRTFSVEELRTIGTVSSQSAFVKETTGVDNVCERSARYACQEGNLIQPKICTEGCTFALVERKKQISF